MKRMALFVLALALMTMAFVIGPATTASACNAPTCFASPGCCANVHCDAFCGGRGFGLCQGQCCACQG
jgi:hypothetical protein